MLLAQVTAADRNGVCRSLSAMNASGHLSNSEIERVTREGAIMTLIQHSEEVLDVFLGDGHVGPVTKPRGHADEVLWKAILTYAHHRRRQNVNMVDVGLTCAKQLRYALKDMGASPLARDP